MKIVLHPGGFALTVRGGAPGHEEEMSSLISMTRQKNANIILVSLTLSAKATCVTSYCPCVSSQITM